MRCTLRAGVLMRCEPVHTTPYFFGRRITGIETSSASTTRPYPQTRTRRRASARFPSLDISLYGDGRGFSMDVAAAGGGRRGPAGAGRGGAGGRAGGGE